MSAPYATGAHAKGAEPVELLFAKSLWEVDPATPEPLEALLRRLRRDGFGASELFLPTFEPDLDEARALHERLGLQRIAAIASEGDTPAAHLASLERQLEGARRLEPLLVNAQAGRDWFALDDNLRVLEGAMAAAERAGLQLCVETHRSRPTFALPNTLQLLDALPELRLTADVSHWMVVHESDLRDQWPALQRVLERVDHIHARVGFEEGPQVNDPAAPEWAPQWANHLEIWQRVVDLQRERGRERLTLTPEFGPPPYAPTLPYTMQPLADVWRVNVAVRERLARELR